MNDEFLHALRRDPPPAFVRELKRRLDRMPARRGARSALGRTLLAMFLIGGVAMAATLLLRNRDEPPREAAPVAQAVVPKPATPEPQPAAPQPERHVTRTDSAASSPQAQPSAAEDPSSTFATSASTRTMAQVLVDIVRRFGSGQPRVAVMDDAEALRALCANADFAMVTRRIAEAELTRCWNKHIDVAEWMLGYQAVVLTAGPTAQPAALKPREIFLALARRIPDPADPSQLIDNPNTTWHDVDTRFDYRSIDVLMPSDAMTRTLFVQLIMEAGCDTYRWIRALKQTNAQRYDEICHQLRNDERLHEVELVSTTITQQLWAEPNWLVVLAFSDYDQNRTKLLGTMLEGPVPTLASLIDGTYPAARPVYVYAQRLRITSFGANRSLAYALTDGYWLGPRYGLVRVDGSSDQQTSQPIPPALESLQPKGARDEK
jgi:ABC-type phosphate transport system substrate-binding protein